MNLKRTTAIILSLSILASNIYVEAAPFKWLDDALEAGAEVIDKGGEKASKMWEENSEKAVKLWNDGTEIAGQAFEKGAEKAKELWDTKSAQAVQLWKDGSEKAVQLWYEKKEWAMNEWDERSVQIVEAWNSGAAYVIEQWEDKTEWATCEWGNFTDWAKTIINGNPYDWIEYTVLQDGILAYDQWVSLREFRMDNPSLEQIQERFNIIFEELSLLEQDGDFIWEMLKEWSNVNGITLEQTANIMLPFLERLRIEGGSAIGEGVILSGPVVGSYLVTIAETLKPKDGKEADYCLRILDKTMDSLTRPIIIGEEEQNVLVTEDGYIIENFTYEDGKYQIVMLTSQMDKSSEYPNLKGMTIDKLVGKYFEKNEILKETENHEINSNKAEILSFSSEIGELPVTGKAVAIWTPSYGYLYFVLSDQEWDDAEFNEWLASFDLTNQNQVTFSVDMESDGAFYGINQTAQKYTINRIFDEEKFTAPVSGHGWSAERGNNLIDNMKGIFKGQHAKVVGDDNVKNGADRIIENADGSRLLIQTKYYNDASRSIGACFEEGKFKYLDVDGQPMAVEVPKDQYEAAVKYMENRIQRGEVPGVDKADIGKAKDIVKEGNLTYQQARHIAKAGTVESILYDSAHACVTAGTSMGISAAVEFAGNIWNGESFENAIKNSVYSGLKTGGTSFVVSVFSSQLSKTGLNSALVPATEAITKVMGPGVSAKLVNAFRPAGSQIYGAAAMKSAAKLLRGNMITNTVTFVVYSAGDISDIVQGKISLKQLAKNMSTTAAGIAGGSVGYMTGAAIGTAILPGVGTAAGLIVGCVAGWGASEGADALADFLADDDADLMIEIIETQFTEIAQEYFLNEEELEQAIENLQNILSAKMLKEMYQYKNHEEFARQLIEMCIDPIVAEREFIELPSEDSYAQYVEDILLDIYEDLDTEETSEEK